MTEREMSAEQFCAWRQSLGIGERTAATLLGISRSGLRSLERDGAPRYILLAICALQESKVIVPTPAINLPLAKDVVARSLPRVRLGAGGWKVSTNGIERYMATTGEDTGWRRHKQARSSRGDWVVRNEQTNKFALYKE